MTSTVPKHILRFFWKDFLGDFLAFPLWWYSRGTLRVITYIMDSASRYAYTLSLRIWIKNLFVPMYGQYDLAGRAISFVLRIVVLFYRTILFVFWVFILLGVLCLWIFGPLLVVWYMLFQLFGVTVNL